MTTSVRLTPFLDELPIPPVLDGTTGATLNLTISQTPYFFHDRWKNARSRCGATTAGQKAEWLSRPDHRSPEGHADHGRLRQRPAQEAPAQRGPHPHADAGQAGQLAHPYPPARRHIGSCADGNPYAGGRLASGQTVPDFLSGQTQKVSYRNDQEAAHIWYHDHAFGHYALERDGGACRRYLCATRRRRAGGQLHDLPGRGCPAGTTRSRSSYRTGLLPRDGRIKYPAQVGRRSSSATWSAVNGKVWPFKNVEPRKYRMRILNGSNSRFYNLEAHRWGQDGPRSGRTGDSCSVLFR